MDKYEVESFTASEITLRDAARRVDMHVNAATSGRRIVSVSDVVTYSLGSYHLSRAVVFAEPIESPAHA